MSSSIRRHRARLDVLVKLEPQRFWTLVSALELTRPGKLCLMMLYHCLLQSVHCTLAGMLGTSELTTSPRSVCNSVSVKGPVTVCKFVKNSVGQSVLLLVLRAQNDWSAPDSHGQWQ